MFKSPINLRIEVKKEYTSEGVSDPSQRNNVVNSPKNSPEKDCHLSEPDVLPGVDVPRKQPTCQGKVGHVYGDPEIENAQESDSGDQDAVKEYSYQQRVPLSGEPVCVVCGKYGEYICDETDHDVCSRECKKIDIERTKANNFNRSDLTMKERAVSLNNAVQAHFQICPNIFHAQLTSYIPHPEIIKLSEIQVKSLLTKNRITVQGKSIPRPIASFAHCNLPSTMSDNLLESGYVQPTPIQMQVISAALFGRDVLASAQTGSGKTVAFLIPIIVHAWSLSQFHEGKGGPYAVIMAPTRELCMQIEDQTKKLIKGLINMRTALIVGGLPMPNQVHRLKKGVQIAIVTPGRFLDVINQHEEFNMNNIHIVVIDEVDMMFKMGFVKQVTEILGKMLISSTNVYRQTLMFSATIPESVEKLANSMLRDHIRITIGDHSGKNTANDGNSTNTFPNIPVKQTILWVENKSKKKQLFSLLNDPKYYKPPIVIFVESKLGADLLSQAIEKKCGIRALSLHGDKPQEERTRILQSFLNGEFEIIVATGILSRGLDLPGVNMVVNFDMATTVGEYVHQVGRVGGTVNQGWAITFINEDNKNLFKEFVTLLRAQPSGRVTPLPSKLLNHGYTLYGNNKGK
ncbi:16400_t:CDS:2 [Acaulospora morrowiae]|uniref:RNA helicase n=1 Tax=Acaulospora morrowiae TaxID=94023 RepID=A0A9N8V2Z9_9GLOM|nr:16400_t:CDS:2 [Acaulospora morrowiae]